MLRPQKRFGQHFLFFEGKLNCIAQKALTHSRNIIEIGPGTGNLTKALFKFGAQNVIAIELDRRFEPYLTVEKLRPHTDTADSEAIIAQPRLSIIWEDVLKINFDQLITQFNGDCVVVGNLPYNISAPLLVKLFTSCVQFKKGVFLVQKELADKLTADVNTTSYSKITILARSFVDVVPSILVPPKCFSPAPKVMSQVIVCTAHIFPEMTTETCIAVTTESVQKDTNSIIYQRPNYTTLNTITGWAFSSKRKMISNTLGQKWPNVLKILTTMGIMYNVRAENIPVQTYIALSHIFDQERPI